MAMHVNVSRIFWSLQVHSVKLDDYDSGRRSATMIEICGSVISNMLTALYQPFWFAFLLAILFMFVWKKYRSIKEAFLEWVAWFKAEASFRRMFFLIFYTVMILFRTLLNRTMWANPVSNVIGIWGLHNAEGKLTTEVPENLALFIPFTILLLWTYRDKILNNDKKDNSGISLQNVLWQSTKIVFLFSFTIEMLQLFLRLGTWQLSDLFYNTLV